VTAFLVGLTVGALLVEFNVQVILAWVARIPDEGVVIGMGAVPAPANVWTPYTREEAEDDLAAANWN
jgi:hypothetical protein